MYTRHIQSLVDRLPMMPLGAGTPDPSVFEELEDAMLERLFGGALIREKTPARLCQAGLWLLAGHLEKCHEIAQSVGTPDGSLWHAIVHRGEGDFSNSIYWYRRTGEHAVYPALLAAAAPIAANDPMIARVAAQRTWNPVLFVECCRSALDGRCDADACRRIAQAEWRLLFDWCYRKATQENERENNKEEA